MEKRPRLRALAPLRCLVLLSLSHIAGTTLNNNASNLTLESTLVELHQNLRDTAHVNYYDQSNVHRNMQEITQPIERLGVNLEFVGNYFVNESRTDYAQKALEKACPLLNLISHKDSIGCLNTLNALYRQTPTAFPDEEAIIARARKLLDPYQHLKIELWLKEFLQQRLKYTSNYEDVIIQFLSQFSGHESLHRISLISQNLFSELLIDDNDTTRLWAESALDTIHQYIWESKMTRTPPIHLLNQDLDEDSRTHENNQMMLTSMTDDFGIIKAPATYPISTPNYIPDLIYWQWTVSNPTKYQSTQIARPPTPSLSSAKGQQLLSSHHRLDPVASSFEPLIPPLAQPRSAVTTVQANGSTLLILVLFLLTLTSALGVLFYSSSMSAPSTRRKPKRTPKKSLIDQIDDYLAGLTYPRSLWSIVSSPFISVIEPKQYAQRQVEQKRIHPKNTSTATPWVWVFLKVCEVIMSSMWTFFSRFARYLFWNNHNVSEAQSAKVHFPSEIQSCSKKISRESIHHSAPTLAPAPSTLHISQSCDPINTCSQLETSPQEIVFAPSICSSNEVCPELSVQPEAQVLMNCASVDTSVESEAVFVESPKVPPQLPIRIQTKKEKRNEKLKRSSVSASDESNSIKTPPAVAETKAIMRLSENFVISSSEMTSKLELSLGNLSESSSLFEPVWESPKIASVNLPDDALNVFAPTLQEHPLENIELLLPHIIETVDVQEHLAANMSDTAPLSISNILEFEDSARNDLNDTSLHTSQEMLETLDLTSLQVDTFGPPPGFSESSTAVSPSSLLTQRPSLLADLNETSEVFTQSPNLQVEGPAAPLSSRSRAVGFSQSPCFYEFSTPGISYGDTPFFSGDVDWTQPYLDALDQHGVASSEEIFSETVPPLVPSSSQINLDFNRTQTHWTRENEYQGSSHRTISQSYPRHQYSEMPSYLSYQPPNLRRSIQSNAPFHGRGSVSNPWMVAEHSRHPNWQYYAQNPSSNSYSRSSKLPPPMNLPIPQTIKLTLTVKVRLLPAPRVAQVKIASSIFGRWSINDALSMKSSASNPGLWGVTVEIPGDVLRFSYLYVAVEVGGRVWVEHYTPRIIDFGVPGYVNEISQEDTFERGRLQSGRGTLDFEA